MVHSWFIDAEKFPVIKNGDVPQLCEFHNQIGFHDDRNHDMKILMETHDDD